MLVWREVMWKKQNTAGRIYLLHTLMYHLNANHALVELSIPTTVNREEFKVIGHVWIVIIHDQQLPCNKTDLNHLTAVVDF